MKWCIAAMKVMIYRTKSFQQGLFQTVDLEWVDGTIISIIKVRGYYKYRYYGIHLHCDWLAMTTFL